MTPFQAFAFLISCCERILLEPSSSRNRERFVIVLKTTLKTRPRELQKPLQRKNDACPTRRPSQRMPNERFIHLNRRLVSRGAVKALPLVDSLVIVLKTTLKTRPRELQKPLQRKNDACPTSCLAVMKSWMTRDSCLERKGAQGLTVRPLGSS